MGITSLQVCMDSSDWLQGTISEEYTGGGIMDSSPISTPSGGEDSSNNNINNLLGCSISPPLMAAERRLRPQHEQSPKCPRCESTHTKFCYYNNYSLSQPRYFCKTCRRYWTKGGTLRNIPVGGGCRKNKKVSSSSSSASAKKSDNPSPPPPPPPSALILNQPSSSSSLMNRNHNNNTNDDDHLHLGFPDQLHFSSLHASGLFFSNPGNFLLENNIINNPTPIEFMDNKYDNFVGNNNGESFGGIMAEHNNVGGATANTYFHGFPFGFSSSSSSVVDHSAPNNILESCQRLMMPYDHQNNHYNNHHNEVADVKPNSKILSLEWNDHHHQQQSATTTKDPFGVGYNFGGLGSWTGLMNGYGSSATNPLV